VEVQQTKGEEGRHGSASTAALGHPGERADRRHRADRRGAGAHHAAQPTAAPEIDRPGGLMLAVFLVPLLIA
jgi:hypothetical protein